MDETRPPQLPQLLKIGQVAEILQISRTSAYRLAVSGDLPSVKFMGVTVRVRPEDLDRYIMEHLNGNSSYSHNIEK